MTLRMVEPRGVIMPTIMMETNTGIKKIFASIHITIFPTFKPCRSKDSPAIAPPSIAPTK